MVGHYLLTLSPAAEHDVLTEKMGPGNYHCILSGNRCVVGCAGAYDWNTAMWGRPQYFGTTLDIRPSVETRYDQLCYRFSDERINRAIRNRILSNQARRALAGVRELVET